MRHTIHVRLQADATGRLTLVIPHCPPGEFFQLTVVLDPESPPPERTPEELGYPPGFFEQTVGKWQGELERPPQGELPPAPEF